ncbi:hypothetical protein EJB05_06957 [Eragrostis curvula]|uniref:F-box domain-containing protein n=1 Tax=Eragrostis curvula TaxID=38414 RepID=A0A5J9WGD0_9POAL|nr:hypothetical protein EJB05_06957 [Eragrostis curvula]
MGFAYLTKAWPSYQKEKRPGPIGPGSPPSPSTLGNDVITVSQISLRRRRVRSSGTRRNWAAKSQLRSHLETMAGTTRAPARRLRFLIDLPEEILSEILLLLPPKYILRCRAVCKDLLRVVSDHSFLVAHHRRQPPRRLFSFLRDVGDRSDDLGLFDYCVESFDLRNHEFQSVVRFTADDYSCLEDDSPLAIHAACDGLLLMSFENLLYLCNPTTRQWVSISRPSLRHDTIMGLYAHGSSSEYRVLYCRRNHGNPLFFISTVNSEIERCIHPSLSSASMKKWMGKRSEDDHLKEPFLFNGNLHWLPCLGRQKNNILVFDTLREIFWWLRVPFKIRLAVSLLEVKGTLAMSNSHMGSSKVDVWFLLDYRNAVWVRKWRIVLPVLDIQRFEERDWCPHVVSQERDFIVDGMEWQLHYDINGNLLKKFKCNGHMLTITTHILRESLASHAFFRVQDNRDMREPPFFRGLCLIVSKWFHKLPLPQDRCLAEMAFPVLMLISSSLPFHLFLAQLPGPLRAFTNLWPLATSSASQSINAIAASPVGQLTKPEGSGRIREKGELGRERTRKRSISHSAPLVHAGANQAAAAAMAESSRAAEELSELVLPEVVFANIFARLPAKSIARFRVASKLWCTRASDRYLLLAHHSRQPALPLLYHHRNVDDKGEDAFLMALYYYCLEAVDLHAVLPHRMLVRFQDEETMKFETLAVHGSCDGLLLLSYLDAHFVCNPATRHWARLPPLPPLECHIVGFYAHAASKEYRVLYHRSDDDNMEYYVLAVGSQQPARRIRLRVSSESVGEALGGLVRSVISPPVFLHGSLHWPPRPFGKDNILVFDTAAEVFRWMRPPAISECSKCFLFGTKEGKLALSTWDQNGWMAKLWIMQDYRNEAWAFTYDIQVPVDNRVGEVVPLSVAIVSQYGDMFVEVRGMVLHYDRNGILLQTLKSEGPTIRFTRHFLKESLVQHPFLRKQKDDDPEGPPFFKGL